MNDQAPHGLCECNDDSCLKCGGRGPAAWSVVREGRPMRVCTRCWFSTDTARTPLVTSDEDAEPYQTWDPLGALHLCLALDDVTPGRRGEAAR